MKKIILLLAIFLLMGAGCNMANNLNQADDNENITAKPSPTENQPENTNDNTVTPEDTHMDIYSHTGVLEDVSGGQATGTASAFYGDGSTVLHTEFFGLPEPEGTDFYEGWLVRKDPFDFISTGRAVMGSEPGHYGNDYISAKNYIDYDFYVLTIEPDDGDPAPADHILEGTMFAVF